MSREYKDELIRLLSGKLLSLRNKTGMSQSEISKIIGISRQTYSSIECGNHPMSWNVYLALILFFDNNIETHNTIRKLNAFPDTVIAAFNNGNKKTLKQASLFESLPDNIIEKLDDAAYQAIRNIILLEYARCTNMSGDSIVKVYGGAPESSDFGLETSFITMRKKKREKN